MRDSKFYNMLVGGAPKLPTSSTNATPIVMTTAAHGMSTGDTVAIYAHATNTAANGTWTITKVSATTFSLDGSVGNGIGANTGVWSTPPSRIIDVQDFKTITMAVKSTAAALNCTMQFVGSISEDAPDFNAAISTTNLYEFIDIIDLEDNASIDGDTGLASAGATFNGLYQANVDGLKWFAMIFKIGTAGSVNMDVRLFTNE